MTGAEDVRGAPAFCSRYAPVSQRGFECLDFPDRIDGFFLLAAHIGNDVDNEIR